MSVSTFGSGFELTPTAALLDHDPHRDVHEGTERVLMEVPFVGPLDLVIALAEHIEASGCAAVIAHPERSETHPRAPASRPGARRARLAAADQRDVARRLPRARRGEARLAFSDHAAPSGSRRVGRSHRAACLPEVHEAFDLARRWIGEDAATPALRRHGPGRTEARCERAA